MDTTPSSECGEHATGELLLLQLPGRLDLLPALSFGRLYELRELSTCEAPYMYNHATCTRDMCTCTCAHVHDMWCVEARCVTAISRCWLYAMTDVLES